MVSLFKMAEEVDLSTETTLPVKWKCLTSELGAGDLQADVMSNKRNPRTMAELLKRGR